MVKTANILKLLIFFLFLSAALTKAYAATVDVDLLWQADTNVPYFYKGKALPTPLSRIKVVALLFIENSKINASNLLFEWFLNDEKNQELSGIGKNSFSFNSYIFKNSADAIKVKISNSQRTIDETESLTVKTAGPKILFYEYHPLEGPQSQKAISEFNASPASSYQFIAEPYFIPKEYGENAIYEWSLDNKKLAAEKPLNILDLNVDENSRGSAFASLRIKYKSVLEDIVNSFKIKIL